MAVGVGTAGVAIQAGSTAWADFQSDLNAYQESKAQLKKIGSNKRANEIAQELGYDDAEALKRAFVGKENIKKFNIKYDPKTNEIILESISDGIQVPTGEFLGS